MCLPWDLRKQVFGYCVSLVEWPYWSQHQEVSWENPVYIKMMALKNIPCGWNALDSLKNKPMHLSCSPGDPISHLVWIKWVWHCNPLPPVSLHSTVLQYSSLRQLESCAQDQRNSLLLSFPALAGQCVRSSVILESGGSCRRMYIKDITEKTHWDSPLYLLKINKPSFREKHVIQFKAIFFFLNCSKNNVFHWKLDNSLV